MKRIKPRPYKLFPTSQVLLICPYFAIILKVCIQNLLQIFQKCRFLIVLFIFFTVEGIESISVTLKDRKLTVIGNVDPIDVVNKLRKLWRAELLSFGSDYTELAKKIRDNKKKQVMNKDDDDQEKSEQKQELIKTFQNLLDIYTTILSIYSEY